MALPEYLPGEAEAYIQQKGWQYNRVGTQLKLKTCPFCARSDFKFFIGNDNGLWLCHHARCSKRGNFFTMQRELGDLDPNIKPISTQETRAKGPSGESKTYPMSDFVEFEVNLAEDKDIRDYLAGRGIAIETAQAWHLGSKLETKGAHANKKCLMIPFLTVDGRFCNIKYRGVPEKWFRRLEGHDSILFGEHTLEEYARHEERPLYLTEGELDAITLWQHGFRPAVSTSTGAGSWKTRYYDAIMAYNPTKIYVVYDNDPQGQKGAEEVIKRFDDRDVSNIVLPAGTKDSNEFFLKFTAEDFRNLLVEMPKPEIPNIQFLSSILDDLETEMFLSGGQFRGIKSQFEMINDLIGGGYSNGDLITVSGIPGVGKTTFLMQELMYPAEHDDFPIYMIELEMPKTRLMRKIIEHKFHTPMKDQTIEDVDKARKMLAKVPFAVGSTMRDVDEIERTVRQGVKRHGFRAVAFDNLNFFVRSTDRVTQEISVLTKRMKELAVDLDIPIFLIAQPRKFDDSERAMTIQDLKDSGSIAQDSDVVMLFYRRRIQGKAADVGKGSTGFKGSHSPYTLCRVDKARYDAGGECYLYFDGSKSTYRELLPDEAKAEKEAA